MKRKLGKAAIALSGLCVWTTIVAVAVLHGFWRAPISDGRTAAGFVQVAHTQVPEDFAGNLILVALEGGMPVADFAVGPPGSIPDRSSVFQIASLSKWVTAAGVLALVDRGLIGLDDPIEQHLTRWRFPDTELDSRDATVRRLLSHTAGLTDGLGYNGFPAAEDVQTLEKSLNDAADAMEGAKGRVEIGRAPGSRFAYSGGGYTILQMMIEDVTGQTFAQAMHDLVFVPAAMTSSSFTYQDIAERLAPIFDERGGQSPHRFYTALAAASLYTTADDLARFLEALRQPRERGGLLSVETLAAMATPEAQIASMPIWGLGATIYVWDSREAKVIGHDGRNFPAANTAARLHIRSGDGIVVLATGTDRLASDIADAWVYWRTGRVSLTSLDRILKFGIILWIVGLIAASIAAAAMRRFRVSG